MTPGEENRTRQEPTSGWLSAVRWQWGLLCALPLLLLVLLDAEHAITGDLRHYVTELTAMHDGVSIVDTLPEYPAPVLGLLDVLFRIADGSLSRFSLMFVGLMLCTHLAYTLWLARRRNRADVPVAAYFWVVFVCLLGPITFFRFDLVPAVLAGLTVAWIGLSPRGAGVAIALGTAVKVWPIALLAGCGHRRGWRRLLFAALGGLALYAVASIVCVGVDRTLSPLTWQRGRGLQIESLAATPLMVLRSFDPQRWSVAFTDYGAYEISGPGVRVLSACATLAIVVAAAVIGWLALRCWLRDADAAAVRWLCVATVALVILTDKTFSPQYLLWLAAPVAACLARQATTASLKLTAGLLLTTAALTQIIYPLTYDSLLYPQPSLLPTVLLVIRNLLIAVIAGCAIRAVVVGSRKAAD